LESRLNSGYLPIYIRYLNKSGLIPRTAQASVVLYCDFFSIPIELGV